jgi:hypothetical protein
LGHTYNFKPFISYNRTFLGENKHTTTIRTLENVRVHHFETLKFYKNKPYTLFFLTPLKFSHPLYLPNGEQLKKHKHTTTIRALENIGVGHFKS